MKKTPTPRKAKKAKNADLRPEYRFDYNKARPNRFAARMKKGSRVVVLDPDVAEVFTSPQKVNTVLRALLSVLPQH